MAERGIDTQPPHTRGAGNITLCTAPRPLAAAKPSAAPIGPGAPIVLTRARRGLGAPRDTSPSRERARKYKSERREPGGGGALSAAVAARRCYAACEGRGPRRPHGRPRRPRGTPAAAPRGGAGRHRLCGRAAPPPRRGNRSAAGSRAEPSPRVSAPLARFQPAHGAPLRCPGGVRDSAPSPRLGGVRVVLLFRGVFFCFFLFFRNAFITCMNNSRKTMAFSTASWVTKEQSAVVRQLQDHKFSAVVQRWPGAVPGIPVQRRAEPHPTCPSLLLLSLLFCCHLHRTRQLYRTSEQEKHPFTSASLFTSTLLVQTTLGGALL